MNMIYIPDIPAQMIDKDTDKKVKFEKGDIPESYYVEREITIPEDKIKKIKDEQTRKV